MNRLADSMTCRLVRLRLAGGAVGGDHLESCLACQAEAARYRSLRRQLASLKDVTVDAPSDLHGVVTARIVDVPQQSSGPARRNKAAVAGASSVAAAAVAGVVMVLARRRARAA